MKFVTLSGEVRAWRDENRISLDFPMNDPVENRRYEEKAMVKLFADYAVDDVRYTSTMKMLLVRLGDQHTRLVELRFDTLFVLKSLMDVPYIERGA